eukprot:359173-Amphidinium_carterae.1
MVLQGQGTSMPVICDFLCVVLLRLSSMPSSSAVEQDAITMLSHASEAQREIFPAAIQRRIWERAPENFLARVATH